MVWFSTRHLVKFFSKEKELIRIGMQFLIDGNIVTIKQKVRSTYKKHKHMRYNPFQCYQAESLSGQRMYIQQSDVMCNVRETKKVGTNAIN